MGLFGHKIETYIGVDIGAHGMKLVELRKNKNRPQLWTYGAIDRELDIHASSSPNKTVGDLIREHKPASGRHPEPKVASPLDIDAARVLEYAELLRTLLKKSRVVGKRVASSLPASQVFHTIINLPKVDAKEVGGMVQAEVAKMLPRPLDEMQVVHQQVPLDGIADKNYLRLLVTAAPRELVAFYTAIFHKAGLELQELETEAFALSRALVGHDDAVAMLVDIGAERTNFSIIDRGLPMTQRSLQIGGGTIDLLLADRLGLPPEQIRQLKKDISRLPPDALSPDTFVRIFDPLAKEIQYHFDLYLHQTGNESKRPEKIILTGGAALFPPLLAYLKKQFSLRVFVGDPWARVIYQDGLKSILNEVAPRMAVSIGLALRNF